MESLTRKSGVLLLSLATSLGLYAQDGDAGLDVDITVDNPAWYQNVYLWIGIAAFVIIIALIARGRN